MVLRLCPDQRKPIEEWDQTAGNVREAVDLPLPALVPCLANRSAAERLHEELERSPILLRDVESGRDLPLPPVVAATTTDEHEAGLT
jgi:hypothetical protein